MTESDAKQIPKIGHLPTPAVLASDSVRQRLAAKTPLPPVAGR